jgi:putative tryptophan/tyrosine transport system substrate-binding protein
VKRREFIALAGTALTALPFAASAQQPLPGIGYLSSASQATPNERVGVFVKALKAAGFEDHRNVTIHYRFAEGHLERLAAFAADLVQRQVQVIVVPDSVPTAKAAQAATSTIPIVFGVGDDPVRAGLVASLNHPGGNLTGVTRMNWELEPRRLQMLHELVPAARMLALLVNADNPNATGSIGAMQEGARSIGSQLTVVSANRETDLDRAFSEIVSAGAGGVVISPDPFFFLQNVRLGELALAHRLPAIFQYREFVAAGGLAGYGGNSNEAHRLLAEYAARILKGEKPADLPVQQYARFELILNLKTAKALGLTVPRRLLALADEVIE